jgi:hypothetical protein
VREDASALLAAARTEAATGRLEAAVRHYDAYVNIHTRRPERPRALLELGQVLARLERRAAALQVFEWIQREYAGSAQAYAARLGQLRLDSGLPANERAEAYRRAAEQLADPTEAAMACREILETLLAAGEPLRAVSTLGWMAKNGAGASAAAARQQLLIGIEPALTLLADRGDDVGLAAVLSEAESVGVILSPGLLGVARAASRRLGLVQPGDEMLAAARDLARAGRWEEVAAALEGAVSAEPGFRAARLGLLAEAAWRLGRNEEALSRLNDALAHAAAGRESRELLVLRADVLLSTGQRAAACADYTSARVIAPSPWVDRRALQCVAVEGQP